MKLLSSHDGSFNELRQLKSAFKTLSKCVCASSKATRTKSPYPGCDEDDEDGWLLAAAQPSGLNTLPEVTSSFVLLQPV
jgi:hypothetical protein